MTRSNRYVSCMAATTTWLLLAASGAALAQNDWQSPDPYFGVFQHRSAGTPQAEQRYRAEIAPQQPIRLRDIRPPESRPRWHRHRSRPPR